MFNLISKNNTMKKVYLSLFALILCGYILAQDNCFVKAGMSNSDVEQAIMEAFKAQGWPEKPVKVIINSRDWNIRRNDATGIITGRSVNAQVYSTKKTKCLSQDFNFVQSYDGSGYSKSMYMSGIGDQHKVDCACLSNLTGSSENTSPSNENKTNSAGTTESSKSTTNSSGDANPVSITKENPAYAASLSDYEKNKENGNGPYKSFSEGKITSEGQYKNGHEQGLWKSYETDGSISSKDYYTNGDRDSAFSYSSKVLRTVVRYKDNKENGKQEEYRSNGKLQKLATYKNGTLEGKYGEYNENGTVYIEGDYKEGQKNGIWKEESGSEMAEGNYKNGQKDGAWVSKDKKTGKVNKTEKYVEGELKN